MPTVTEILEQTGFTKEQIAALDPKLVTTFSGIMTDAEQKQAAAVAAAAKAEADRQAAAETLDKTQLERRSLNEFYETKVVTGLTGWEEEQKKLRTEAANAQALAAFYEAQNKSARDAGFIAAEAPKFTPAAVDPNAGRDGQGRFVAGAPGGTPGSPSFIDPNVIAGKIGDVAGIISDIQWKHNTLFGRPLPMAPSELIRQADAVKLSPMDYAARQFGFAAREAEMSAQEKAAHDKAIADAAVAARDAEHKAEIEKIRKEQADKDRQRAEGGGNNPEVRAAPGSSEFAEVRKAVQEGARPDPLKLTDAQRRQATRQAIHSEIQENETAAVA
jgi:hypothetical protein